MEGISYRIIACIAACGLTACIGIDLNPEPFPTPDTGTVDGGPSGDATLPDGGMPDDDMSGVDMGPPVEAPEGYTTGRILYRGSEGMLFHQEAALGFTLDGYDIMSWALSGDGRVAWVALYNEYAEGGPDYRVYSMNIDGSNVQESSLVRPADAPYFPGGFRVRTTGDGEVAILTQYTKDSEGRTVAQFERASRGGAFAVLTQSDGEVESQGLADSVHTEVTDDGSAIMFTTGRHIWRANESDGWVPFVVMRAEDLQWNGEALPWNSYFYGLDITDNGGEFATFIPLTDGRGSDSILVGTGIGATAFEATDRDYYVGAEIDGAGEVVTYSGVVPKQSWIGPQGGTHDEITGPIGTIDNIDLADDGQSFHAVLETTLQAPFFQSVGGDDRVFSMSPTWITLGSIPNIGGQLSDDGSVLLTRTWGLLAVHKGVVAYGAHVDNIFWRFDEEGDLIVRARVRSADPIQAVTVMSLVDRQIRPYMLYTYDEDPTFTDRLGVTMTELEDEPGTFEGKFDIRPEATMPLDERYSFRVTVVQGENGNESTGFADFDLFE